MYYPGRYVTPSEQEKNNFDAGDVINDAGALLYYRCHFQ